MPLSAKNRCTLAVEHTDFKRLVTQTGGIIDKFALMGFTTVYKLLLFTFQCQVDHTKCTKTYFKNTLVIKSSTMHNLLAHLQTYA